MNVTIKKNRSLITGFINVNEVEIGSNRIVDGKKTTVSRQIVSKPDAAAVLIYDETRSAFVMVEQLRLAAQLNLFSEQKNGILPEIVAGNVDLGESPEEAAIREVKEETGYVVKSLQPIGQGYSSPGYSTEKIYLFYTTLSKEIRNTRVARHLDIDEDILVTEWSLDFAKDQLRNGSILDLKTQLAFLWFFSQA